MTAIVAVTGVVDDVDDVIQPGAFARTLRERDPRMVLGHDWLRPVGRTISAVELLPGDPRLPRTAPDGTPWPRAAGALLVKARFLLGTRDGREAYEVAKAFGASQAFSIGFKVTPGGSRQRGQVRVITDLDVYEYSPVLHGANRLATQLTVKGSAPAALEHKGVVRTAGRRLLIPASCSICGRPAAASLAAPQRHPPHMPLVRGRRRPHRHRRRVPRPSRPRRPARATTSRRSPTSSRGRWRRDGILRR